MGKFYKIFIWKKAPFLRLLLPVIVGIIAEYYLKFEINIILTTAIVLLSTFLVFNILPLVYRFKLQPINGIIITAFIINAGFFLTWNKDARHHGDWYGKKYDSSSYIIATINEPPVEKNKSYKALATVNAIIKKGNVYNTSGKLLIYLSKDSISNEIVYGDRIIIKKELQRIKNSGNPAAFNYERYCAFQQIYHQCYLKKNEWILLSGNNTSLYWKTIFTTQRYVVNVLDKYIKGKNEASIANALVIGYKVDLDKDLVQAYSNAGVIHLIVIAGLHLGLIYGLLFWITGKIPFLKKSKAFRLFIIVSLLWFFALLTGASPPVLRAVVMFSVIAIGKIIDKNTSVYNSLSVSAFIILCINPYSLWDAGFQLSYLAVTGIVTTQKYIYGWFYIQNKILNEVWKIASVSLSAQLFTFPVCLYYFHQMPLLFILTNILAIPLAIFTLYACIFLILISKLSFVALYLGKMITASIWLLNHIVFFVNSIPFSLWDGISITVTETFILYSIIILSVYGLIKKDLLAFKFALFPATIFFAIIALAKWNFSSQRKLIVYDVPSHKAIDFINGNTYQFFGDSDLIADGLLKNFHLQPTRISLMVSKNKSDSIFLFHRENFFGIYGKRILMIDSEIVYIALPEKINVDYIIISKNPKLFIPKLAAIFNCGVYIFDASNPLWKIEKWKKDCEELHLRFHSVPEQGAFITDL